jgi:hypothetical protein
VGGVSGENNKQQQQQALQQGLLRKEEGTSQLQDWNVECKNLESMRHIGKSEK